MNLQMDRMSHGIARRQFLAGAIASGIVPRGGLAGTERPEAATLRAMAERGGLFWGAAVQSAQIKPETDFAALVVRECSVVVPEWEMKWTALERERGQRKYGPADAIVKFAEQHQLKVRGHALVWHRAMPQWVKETLKQDSDWNVLASFIAATLDRYSGSRFIHWDVVNEVIEPKDGRADGLRASPYLHAFGPDYIRRALVLAHEHAPSVRLYVNEYGLDYDGQVERDRRAALLRLIESLKKSDTPFHGIGIQGHLYGRGRSPFSQEALRRFLADVAAHGLKITITELDVPEADVSLPVEERDRRVAAEVARYLDVVMDEPAVEGIVTWGLSDRYSWLNAKLRGSGTRNRGLPFDENLAPKPVKQAIVETLARRPSPG
jgi:endo-1,4-beta-xylanase